MPEVRKPHWARTAIVYQIYPRSFKDTNGDGIGDIAGIIEKLPYLKELGIDAVWISPVYPSPMADFGYDISDFYGVDSLFGTMKDFEKLLKEAHKLDIKVLMDLVLNHTSSKHPWFLESKSSKNNPKRNWYVWADPKPDGSPPNNWLSYFGGSAWTLDKNTGQYYFHAFDPEQPDINWRDEGVKDAMFNVVRFWLKKGVDGFRIDAIYWLFEDRRLRDEPPNPNYVAGSSSPHDSLLHIYTIGHEETVKFLREFVDLMEEFEDKAIIVEGFYKSIEDMETVYER